MGNLAEEWLPGGVCCVCGGPAERRVWLPAAGGSVLQWRCRECGAAGEREQGT